ncbi:MAG: hypothetical protein K6C96_03865 [Butyrivibrio sp.]|nr:hypothetical protein [Butyrivibrio sp.]
MEKELKKNLFYATVWTAFLALFGAIYELFSHGVTSYYMIYAFGIPLIMGVLPYEVMLIKNKFPGKPFTDIWNTAIATLSIGCVFKGVLEIYGTTNRLIIVYPIAGAVLVLISLLSIYGNSKKDDSMAESLML